MNTRDTVYIALFAAIYAAINLIPPIVVPFIAVPITAQSLGPMIAGSILGAKRGALATLLFLGLVAAGLPLLPGGRGGFGVFLGPTAGYLVSYAVAAFVIGFLFERLWMRLNFVWALAANILGGIGIVYLIGIPWFSQAANLPLSTVLLGSAVFVPGDLVKASIAAFVTMTVKRAYPIMGAT